MLNLLFFMRKNVVLVKRHEYPQMQKNKIREKERISLVVLTCQMVLLLVATPRKCQSNDTFVSADENGLLCMKLALQQKIKLDNTSLLLLTDFN